MSTELEGREGAIAQAARIGAAPLVRAAGARGDEQRREVLAARVAFERVGGVFPVRQKAVPFGNLASLTAAVSQASKACDAGPPFDRSAYRPALTEAGRALLPHARRIAEEVGAFQTQALSIAGGLETELTLAVDSMFPMAATVEALRQFNERFPAIQPRVFVESLGGAMRLVLDGVCGLGLIATFLVDPARLARVPLLDVELVMTVAPSHPLARMNGRIAPALLRDHVQLVLSDRTGMSGPRDFGVQAHRTWRLADLAAKHAMLKAGLGFGSMPAHMIADDLADGQLVRIEPEEWDGRAQAPVLPFCAAHLIDAPVGPATRWIIACFQRLVGADNR